MSELCRAMFEANYKAQYGFLPFRKKDSAEYIDVFLNHEWKGFSAGWSVDEQAVREELLRLLLSQLTHSKRESPCTH